MNKKLPISNKLLIFTQRYRENETVLFLTSHNAAGMKPLNAYKPQ